MELKIVTFKLECSLSVRALTLHRRTKSVFITDRQLCSRRLLLEPRHLNQAIFSPAHTVRVISGPMQWHEGVGGLCCRPAAVRGEPRLLAAEDSWLPVQMDSPGTGTRPLLSFVRPAIIQVERWGVREKQQTMHISHSPQQHAPWPRLICVNGCVLRPSLEGIKDIFINFLYI